MSKNQPSDPVIDEIRAIRSRISAEIQKAIAKGREKMGGIFAPAAQPMLVHQKIRHLEESTGSDTLGLKILKILVKETRFIDLWRRLRRGKI